MNFTLDGLSGAENAVQRLMDFMNALQAAEGDGEDVSALLQQTQTRFEEALDDDLNIAGALGAIFEMVREVNRAIAERQLSPAAAEQVTTLMRRFDTVLGILADDDAIDARAEALLLKRQEARQQRNFARADAIRDELQQMGYAVEDSPQGSRLKRL
jgi:cysteinyl-tRNA synthetase